MAREQHPVSHGSWQNRYKISIGDRYLRFTVNTGDGIRDLDSKTPLEPERWYHLAAIYNGKDMEIWLDGKLDAFTAHSGLLRKTTYDLVMGQNLPGENGYNFKGAMSALSIFDFGLSPGQIEEHMENSISLHVQEPVPDPGRNIEVFPNPVSGPEMILVFRGSAPEDLSCTLFDLSGKQAGKPLRIRAESGESTFSFPLGRLQDGVYLLSIAGKDWSENRMIVLQR
jgi:hypothetical protein